MTGSFTPDPCCCRFLWCLATSTAHGTLALQIAASGEWRPLPHEFTAIRAVSPALAWVQNSRIRAFYSREIALSSCQDPKRKL